MNARTPPIEVRRAYLHVALGRIASVAGLVAAMGFLALDSGDSWAPSVTAFWLVTFAWEARKTGRPIARIDEGGMTYTEGWITRRVCFADVVAWEHDSGGVALRLTTRDGSEWGVNLGEVASTDRESVLGYLTAHLPPASIRERWKRPSSPFLCQGLAELALLAVLVLATTQLIGVASGWRAPATSEPSLAHRTTAGAWDSQYGPRARAYVMPPPPHVDLPLRFDPYSGPWRFSNCHIEPLVGACVARTD